MLSEQSPWTVLQVGARGSVIAALWCCLFCFSSALASVSDFVPPPSVYVHRVWQSEDGLPNNSVRAIMQSRNGYLWVATDGGLSKFDGMRFTDIERKAGERRSRWIVGIAEANDGSIWTSSVNGGAARFKDGQLTHYSKTNGLLSDSVLCIQQDSRSNLWFGTAAGLCRFVGGQFVPFQSTGLVVEAVRTILEDRQHNLWIGTAKGLGCISPDGQAVTYTTNDFLISDAIMSLYEDKHGGLWIGTAGGLTYWKDGKAKSYTDQDGLAHNVVRDILEDVDGNIWVGTQGGVQQFSDGQFRFVTINNMENPDLEGTSYVYCMMQDREGNMWVGNSVGLNCLRKQSFVTYTKEQGLPSNETTCVMEDREGNLWIGTYGSGLCRIHGNEIEVITTREGLADNYVLSLWQDHSGTIWIGMDGAGLQSLKDDIFTHYVMEDPKQNVVRVLFEDGHSNIWAGSNLGLSRLVGDRFATRKNYTQNTIKAIAHDSRSLWFTGELALFRMTSGTIHAYTREEGLSQTVGNAVYPDNQVCWVGTDEGLYCVDDDHISKFSRSPLLGREPILHIVEDDDKRLWMTSRNGVMIAYKQDLLNFAYGRTSSINVMQIGRTDGLKRAQSNGNGQPSGWKTKDGRILFATLHGVIVFDPKTVKPSDVPLPVHIEELSIDGKNSDVRDDVQIPPSRGNVQFRYTALSFQAPEKITFKYMLEGFDQDWVDAGTRRTASYQLKTGNYRFKVIAADRNGTWNLKGATVAFTLQPHFYETYWFYGLCGIGGIAAVVGLIMLRHAQAKQREKELMRLVEVHTAKYRNAAQSMESFNYSIAHDLRGPLRAIKGFTEALTEDFVNSMDPAAREYAKRIIISVERMDSLITDLLSYGQLTHKDFKFCEIDIEFVLSQVVGGLEGEIHARNAKIEIVKPLGTVWANQTLLSQVFANLISNSLKFVEKGKTPVVRVWSEHVGNRTKIFIRDNGIGIEPRFHQRVFGVFERLHRSEEYPGTGIGLAIVHKAVQQMHGTIGLTSELGQGSCFWFELANKPDHRASTVKNPENSNKPAQSATA